MNAEPSQPFYAGNFVKYHPVIKKELGSYNAALLFDRLEFWFSKKKNQFYKFIKPCDHPLYKRGDSWQEEIGISEQVFRRTFDKIGVRYKSKTQFDKAKDKFQGKFFAYYQDRQTKTTIFVRNNDKTKGFYERIAILVKKTDTYKKLDTLFSDNDSDALKRAEIQRAKTKVEASEIGETASKETTTDTEKENRDESNRPKDGGFNCPLYKDNTIYQSSLSNMKKTINSSADLFLKNLEKKRKNEQISDERKQVCNDLIHSWKIIIGDKPIPKLNPKLINKVYNQYQTVFNGSKTEWDNHLHKIASSQFLMGEKKSIKTEQAYQLRFWVAISETFKDNMDHGYYETGTRKNTHFEKAKAYLDEKKLKDELKDLKKSDPVVKVKIFFLEKSRSIYQGIIKPATITTKGDSVIISCATTWAKEYLEYNCECFIKALQEHLNMNVILKKA